jgi:cytochrome c oxidase subunit II
VRTHRSARLRLLRALGGAGLLLLCSCELPIALVPRGPAATEIVRLWWLLFWTALAVCAIVFVLTGVAFVRAQRIARARESAGLPQLRGSPDIGVREGPVSWLEGRTTGFVLIAGGIIPAIILLATTFITLESLAFFDARRDDDYAFTVTVTANRFWWDAEYPDHGFRTANEIHVPVGEKIRIELESADVIHSFWVPQLHGKLAHVPGMTNVTFIEADEPGVYFGKCGEGCGQQHANMEFLYIVEAPAAFEAWAEGQAEDAAEPATELAERGREVFIASPCALCHTIRGVSTAAAPAGPDLTHLASRQTLAARTLVNVRGNLGGWILDPQGIKPGTGMPNASLDSQDFLALLEYLGGLQ